MDAPAKPVLTPEQAMAAEIRALKRGTRRRRRIWAGVILGNLAVFAVIIGGPYLRGRQRALEGRRAFAAFVSCMWGGTTRANPGLLLPEGDRPHYVDRFREQERWPLGCTDELEAVAPDDVFWLLPETRHAESEVRRAVDMVKGELASVEPPLEAGSAVPSRPWLAVQRLVAALAIWCEQADAMTDLRTDAVRFEDALTVLGERLPLRAAQDSEVWMRPIGDGIEALSFDERGISWLHVGGGRVRPQRLRRPRAVSGWIRDGAHVWIVWTTPTERCGEQGCASRAMGLAKLDQSTATTPRPRWFGAHPAGIAQNTLRIIDDHLEAIAIRDGGLELRRFALEESEQRPDEEANAPLAPTERIELPEGLASPLFDEDGSVLALREDGVVRWDRESLSMVHPMKAPHALRRCGPWLAVSGEGFVELGKAASAASDDDAASESDSEVTEDRWAVGSVDGAFVLRCDDEAALVASSAAVFFCDAAGCAQHEHAEVATWDAAVLQGAGLYAYSRDEDHPQIEVVSVTRQGLSQPSIPAACWSEEGELCGRPFMGARRGRAVLGAVDDGDLVVIETNDGTTWRPMSGLR